MSSAHSGLTLEVLERDLEPALAALRERQPVAWVEAFGLWYVTRWDDCDAILRDNVRFAVGTEDSLIFDTFGSHMLTVDGAEQARYRRWFQSSFAPGRLRTSMGAVVEDIVARLIDSFARSGQVELRTAFASRLPVLAVLALFGMDAEAELKLRAWYDAFEPALANFTRDPMVRATAHRDVAAFHELLHDRIVRVRHTPRADLLGHVVHGGRNDSLSDDEIVRNASIIFFGAISTVEALILNCVHALLLHPGAFAQVRADPTLIPAAIDETMRWRSPVQSATRHVVAPLTLRGVALHPGDTVNCMLGAANRDPGVFDSPNQFRLGRPNISRHLGFAAGPHFCLGSHLARLETAAAVRALIDRLPGLGLKDPARIEVRGYEFRQPRTLDLIWNS